MKFEMSGLAFPFLFLSFPLLSGLSRPKRPGQARPGQERPKRPKARPPAISAPGGEGFTRLIRMGLHWITHPGRKFLFFLCFRGLWVVFGSSWKVFWGLEAS